MAALQHKVRRAIDRHTFCTLATVSPGGRAHVVGVLYASVDGIVYVASTEAARKVRNARENPHVAVCIPVRRFPVGPPFCVQFQGTAEVLTRDEAPVAGLLAAGRLKKITGYGVMDDPEVRFLRVTPSGKVFTYGIGVPLPTLLRNPTQADRSVELT